MFFKRKDTDQEAWVSYTDLMSGFLVIFMVTSIFAMTSYIQKEQDLEAEHANLLNIIKQRDSLISLVDVYQDSLTRRQQLRNLIMEYEPLFVGYDGDVKVILDKNEGSIKLIHRNSHLSSRYDLFKSGEAVMNDCLRDFLDRFGKQIVQKTIELRDENSDIEFRIEGHTDPRWRKAKSESGSEYQSNLNSYIYNLGLSSARANSVYTYILNSVGLGVKEQEFLQKHMISVGYSFSDRISKGNVKCPIQSVQDMLDAESRRVEFRIIAQ